MHLLVTNDDGIGSPFLGALVAALLGEGFTLSVAAPATQQSWIGKALSRHRPVRVTAHKGLGVPAWKVAGTPSDCVNIALAHLLKNPPAAVISGMNLGFNTGIPFILASGTVAGALEGALHGLPGIALSQHLPQDIFEQIQEHPGALPEPVPATLHASTARAAALVRAILSDPASQAPFTVHNINFPFPCTPGAAVVRTHPCLVHIGPLFGAARDDEHHFEFSVGRMLQGPEPNDRDTVAAGRISHTLLDYTRLGR